MELNVMCDEFSQYCFQYEMIFNLIPILAISAILLTPLLYRVCVNYGSMNKFMLHMTQYSALLSDGRMKKTFVYILSEMKYLNF